MNSRVKAKWVEALRSGEYKQTHDGRLKIDDCYCTLGVLCDLYVKENNASWDLNEGYTIRDDEKVMVKTYTLFGENAFIPKKVAKWAGIDGIDVALKVPYDNFGEPSEYDESLESISNLNDSFGIDFKEFADLIEQQL